MALSFVAQSVSVGEHGLSVSQSTASYRTHGFWLQFKWPGSMKLSYLCSPWLNWLERNVKQLEFLISVIKTDKINSFDCELVLFDLLLLCFDLFCSCLC